MYNEQNKTKSALQPNFEPLPILVNTAKMLEALLQSLLVSLNITSQKPKAIYPLSSTIKPFFFIYNGSTSKLNSIKSVRIKHHNQSATYIFCNNVLQTNFQTKLAFFFLIQYLPQSSHPLPCSQPYTRFWFKQTLEVQYSLHENSCELLDKN